jgi:hypothetical protein
MAYIFLSLSHLPNAVHTRNHDSTDP